MSCRGVATRNGMNRTAVASHSACSAPSTNWRTRIGLSAHIPQSRAASPGPVVGGCAAGSKCHPFDESSRLSHHHFYALYEVGVT